ncbi:lantibiotic ABC transporter permease [Streptococcus sanguinis]|jgi:hypothetical protein|uniref:lantibiotic ABC transporter permease n=1 Tax=Streptococcus sanguinis TaxID=1305 RepID=UPI00228448B0|nr:lantibiotic ABC transporter permease [Streptococcus sanguinis]MCY7016399.1 lantibiotic ABC transporter permease [Streptococcus sanguinis]
MKKRYYEFLNVLITDDSPIRNLDFYKAGLIELFFILLVFIVSIFLHGEIHDRSMMVMQFTIGHISILLLAFLLFQKFFDTKALQIIPTSSYLFLHFELLFWGSIFFGENHLAFFMIFIILSLSYQLINLLYQMVIVSKLRYFEQKQKINILQIHAIVLCCLSAGVAVITRLFMLSGIYMIVALVGLSIALTPLYLLGYAQVFTGWRNQVTDKW